MIVILKSTRKEEGDVVTTNHALYVCKVLPVNILQHIPPSCALEDPLEDGHPRPLYDAYENGGGPPSLNLSTRAFRLSSGVSYVVRGVMLRKNRSLVRITVKSVVKQDVHAT